MRLNRTTARRSAWISRSPLISAVGSVLFFLVTGCGDPTTSSTATPTAEGLWTGSLSSNRTLTAAILEDGTSYFFYSAVANPAVIDGVIQGTGISSGGAFTSSNAKDFGIGVASLDATVSASFGVRQFLSGSINYAAGGTVSFSSSYNTAYDTAPSIASFAGVYQGQAGSSGGVQPATITVAFDGSFTGTEQSGCTFTGKATLRSRGNILDQTITFGGPPCFFGSATFQGIVYRDLPTNRLYGTAPNSSRTDAAIFFGTKIV